MEGIRMKKSPRLKNPCLIAAWPGMGEVAIKSATYLIDKLKAEEFAEILPEDFFYLTDVTVKEGILDLPRPPISKFYYWKNKAQGRDLIIFVSDAQPDFTKAEEYCQRIIDLAKSFKVKTAIGFAAMPVPSDHTQQPGVWFSTTSRELVNNLKKQKIQMLPEGQISGLNGLFLGLAKRSGLEGFCLLGEIPLYTIQIDNPKASYAVLDVLNKILDIALDLGDLMDQAHATENQINNLIAYLKLGPTPGPIGEEEIEKIKKSLSQLTKLPVSVKEKIENLFTQARLDIARANELKTELDKWNVYKEYEDRFLDLFRKGGAKNN